LFSVDESDDEESLTSIETEADVFEDPSVLEVSIEGQTRFKRNGAVRVKPNLVNNSEEAAVETGEPSQNNESDSQSTGPRTRSTPRVDYAHLHKYGIGERYGKE
jgi:hypothetical protein